MKINTANLKPCEFCNGDAQPYASFYIHYYAEQNTYVLRKVDSIGGVMINYFTWCGRSLYDS